MSEITKCLIIGSGPAGYTAAIYTSRANLTPILYEGIQPGGQLTTTTEIENFPGYPEGTDGFAMMDDLKRQAQRFGTDIRSGNITHTNLNTYPFEVTIEDERTLLAESIIIATGASAKYLGIADEQKYMGQGVSACATCDGFFYRKKTVAVVGGGDTACEEAIYLANLAAKVFLIVRKPALRASKIMQERVLNHPKIEVLFQHETIGLFGEDGLEGANLIYKKGTPSEQTKKIDIDGFFLAIGHRPNTSFLKDQIELDENGYIVTKGNSTATNIEGVFAAGDVADPHYRQAVTAAGSGCKAAIDAERFLSERTGQK